MALKRLVRSVQTFGMILGCVLLLAAIAFGHGYVALAGLVAMSPLLVPFVASEFLGVRMPKFFRPPAAIDDLQRAK